MKPGFVFIPADDLGRYGGRIANPALDRLASEKLHFANRHASSSVY